MDRGRTCFFSSSWLAIAIALAPREAAWTKGTLLERLKPRAAVARVSIEHYVNLVASEIIHVAKRVSQRCLQLSHHAPVMQLDALRLAERLNVRRARARLHKDALDAQARRL